MSRRFGGRIEIEKLGKIAAMGIVADQGEVDSIGAHRLPQRSEFGRGQEKWRFRWNGKEYRSPAVLPNALQKIGERLGWLSRDPINWVLGLNHVFPYVM